MFLLVVYRSSSGMMMRASALIHEKSSWLEEGEGREWTTDSEWGGTCKASYSQEKPRRNKSMMDVGFELLKQFQERSGGCS